MNPLPAFHATIVSSEASIWRRPHNSRVDLSVSDFIMTTRLTDIMKQIHFIAAQYTSRQEKIGVGSHCLSIHVRRF